MKPNIRSITSDHVKRFAFLRFALAWISRLAATPGRAGGIAGGRLADDPEESRGAYITPIIRLWHIFTPSMLTGRSPARVRAQTSDMIGTTGPGLEPARRPIMLPQPRRFLPPKKSPPNPYQVRLALRLWDEATGQRRRRRREASRRGWGLEPSASGVAGVAARRQRIIMFSGEQGQSSVHQGHLVAVQVRGEAGKPIGPLVGRSDREPILERAFGSGFRPGSAPG